MHMQEKKSNYSSLFCFFFFWDIVGVYLYSITEGKRQADILEIALTWLKRALLKDRIWIFNVLQLYQLNQISSEEITYMAKHVRCSKDFAETDHILQENLYNLGSYS